ncbi:MAG: hypothetical protein GC203_11810 [Phenylobacterium sp.]|uniref:hypothetical protein n=1 Tax=Phenylobacterium sp. TaxID=1871053 RepID=UPI0025D71833|nr:hypothetical protein [Phenylobacterium sp.]MBI1198539.1 hypothetical protein [Phenylobacterium sp.]
MSEVPTVDPSAEAQVDAAYQRLLWTGAAVNGALLLALIGFAGNADDPMAALRTITIPAICGITGFNFGGVAISYAIARLTQRPLEAIARTRIAMAHRQMEGFKDVLTSPSMDESVAQLVWGDQADDQMRGLLKARLERAQSEWENSPAVFDAAMKDLNTSAQAGLKLQLTAQKWLVASFVAAALGVVVLVGQAWITKPSDPKVSAVAVAVPTAQPKTTTRVVPPAAKATSTPQLPACPGGAPDCQPWERAWKEPPPVGTVVPGRAEPVTK